MVKYLQLLAVAFGHVGLTIGLFGLHTRYWGTNFSQDISIWAPTILAGITYLLLIFKSFPKLRTGLLLLIPPVLTLVLTLLSSSIALISALTVWGE